MNVAIPQARGVDSSKPLCAAFSAGRRRARPLVKGPRHVPDVWNPDRTLPPKGAFRSGNKGEKNSGIHPAEPALIHADGAQTCGQTCKSGSQRVVIARAVRWRCPSSSAQMVSRSILPFNKRHCKTRQWLRQQDQRWCVVHRPRQRLLRMCTGHRTDGADSSVARALSSRAASGYRKRRTDWGSGLRRAGVSRAATSVDLE